MKRISAFLDWLFVTRCVECHRSVPGDSLGYYMAQRCLFHYYYWRKEQRRMAKCKPCEERQHERCEKGDCECLGRQVPPLKIVFEVTGERRNPKPGEYYMHAGEVHLCPKDYDVNEWTDHPVAYQILRVALNTISV